MKTRFAEAYVISVMSDDHPGIVAALGSAVSRLGGNIDAASQTVLSGYFTLIMIVSFPQPIEPQALAQDVRDAGADGGYQVLTRRYVPIETPGRDKPPGRFVVTAFGADRPGVLLDFTRYLAGKDINIIDLYADRSGEEFVMISQVEIPARWDINLLQADLEQMGADSGFNVRLQHENIFVATNELRMPPDRA